MSRARAAFCFAVKVSLACTAAVSASSGALASDGAQAVLETAVERGKYLADAGNCISCHTRPGGDPFTGGVPFETPFGTIYSTNITPDMETGIGRWTAEDLRRAMQEGLGPNGRRLLPAFPYTSYTKVTDADVAAIYAYLRTLKPIRNQTPKNGFLVSQRWAMALWNAAFFVPGRYVPDSNKSAEWNRGAYLVEGLGHCGACHTPRNSFMAEQAQRAYQGGAMSAAVAGNKVRRWSAVNLTSAKHGLGSWSVDDLTKYLRVGFSARAGTFGPMNEVVVNSLMKLKAEDVRAMAVYLKSLDGPEYTGESVSPSMAKMGESTYIDRCKKCHSESGRGGIFSAPPLAGSAIVQAEDPASLINIILYGPELPKEVSFGAWGTMQNYGDVLSNAEVAALINYLRGSWGNRARPVTAEEVADQR